MAVCRKRSTMSAPEVLSSSYFTGAPPSGISMTAWMSLGGLGPTEIALTSIAGLTHRHEPELVHQPLVAVALGIGRGQELGPVEDRVGAGEETQRLRLLAHVLAPGGEPHHRFRHGDARHR